MKSPIRGETFVTRKITRSVARIETGLGRHALSRKPRAKRDWGHARGLCRGHVQDIAADAPTISLLATGETRSVREFVELAFAEIGPRHRMARHGIEETGVDRKTARPSFASIRLFPSHRSRTC